MAKQMIVIVCGTALLIAAAVVAVVSYNRSQCLPPPNKSVSTHSAEVRVKPLTCAYAHVAEPSGASASSAVSIVCGA